MGKEARKNELDRVDTTKKMLATNTSLQRQILMLNFFSRRMQSILN